MVSLLLVSCTLLTAVPTAPEPMATVSIDMAPLDRQTFEALEQAGIYQALVVRLVTERVALVDPTERADIVLRMEPGQSPDELIVSARGAGGERRQRVSIRDLEHEANRLRLVHVSVDLVRQVRELKPPIVVTVAAAPPRLRSNLALGGGVLWSAGKPGFMGRLAGATPLGPLETGLSVLLHKPSAGSELDVTEWGLMGTIGTRERALGARVRVAGGLDAGLWQHRWRYAGPEGGNGAQLSAAALLHARILLRPAASWRLGLSAGALWTSREVAHRTATRALWRAPQVRPFLGLAIELGREAGK